MNETVVGRCAKINEKPTGWTEFEIDDGRKYPTRLSTKREDLIEKARNAFKAGAVKEWDFTTKESERVNPNSGKPYVNRYLEDVRDSSEGSFASTGSSTTEERMTKGEWDAKERRDFRSRSWAMTISALVGTVKAGEDTDALFSRMQALQRKIYLDITGEFAYPKDESDLPEALKGEPEKPGAYDEPPPPADDDIPF